MTTSFGRQVKRDVVLSTYFSTETYDASDPARTYDERRTRCYELAAAALVFGSAPRESLLVHGSIDGHLPGGLGRIGHAWLELPSGMVWEPITGDLYRNRGAWQHFADAQAERAFSRVHAMGLMNQHGTFGPWFPTKYR